MSIRMIRIFLRINVKEQFYPNALFGDIANTNLICAVIAWFYNLRCGVEERKAEANFILRNAIPKNGEKAFDNLTRISEGIKHQLFINFGFEHLR